MAARSELGFTTIDADGDLVSDDGVISYGIEGSPDTITVLNVDGATLETSANILLS